MGVFDGFFQGAGNAINNATNAVGNVAQGVANTAAQLPGQIINTVEQAPGEFANVAAAPFRDLYAYTRIQMNPRAKAQLDTINNNPKLSDDQRIALGQQLMQKYGGQTDQQSTSAEQGAQLGMGMTSPATGANFISDAAPFIKPAMGQMANTTGDAMRSIANDFTGPNAQAGFIRIPGGEPPVTPAQILDKNGQPFTSPPQPTEMGNYKYNDNTGEMTPNSNPQLPQYSTAQPDITETPGSNNSATPTFQNNRPAITPPQPTPSGPQRTFPTESTSPTTNDIIESQKRNIQIDGHDIQSPQDVAQVNATLNGYGIKGSLTTQLAMVKDTITNLANRAKNLVATQGGTVPKSDIIGNTTKNLSYSAKSTIPSNQALYSATTYIDNLYARAMGKDVTTSITGLTPDQIPGSVLQDMKTLANQDAQGTFSQTDPTKWTQNQTLSRYARDAIDKALDAHYSDASKLNNDMSDLYKSRDSLIKGANQEGKAAQTAANTPPEPRNWGSKYFPNSILGTDMGPAQHGINAATNTSKGAKIAGTILGTAGVTAGAIKGPEFLNNFNKSKQSYAGTPDGGGKQSKGGIGGDHNSSITQLGTNSNDGYLHTADLPQTQNDIKINNDGSVRVASPSQIKDGSGNIIGIDDNSYNKQVKSIKDDMNKWDNLIKQNPNNQRIAQQAGAAITSDKNTLDSFTTFHDSSKPLNDAYSLTTLITGQTAQALHALEQTSPNMADLNGYVDDLQNSLIPRYAALKSQLGVISNEIKGGNLNVKTRDSLISVLKQINQQNVFDYYNKVNSYIGGSTGPSATSLGVPPVAQNYQPQGGNIPSSPQTVDFSGLMDHTSAPSFKNGQPAMGQ